MQTVIKAAAANRGEKKKNIKPLLNDEADGFLIPKKSIKIDCAIHEPLSISSSFAALCDLPEDWDADCDDQEIGATHSTRTDCEVATLTPTKPPTVDAMPPLTPNSSPICIISGVWAFDDIQRKERVMAPSKTQDEKGQGNVWDGWCMLRPHQYSES
jgi:hypothetical protein